MRIIFLRSNPVDPDSRVEKEVNSLIRAGYKVEIVAWDRSSKYKIRESILHLEAGNVKISRFGIPATFGGGIRKNFFSFILFQIRLYTWLFKNKSQYDIIHACDFDTAYTAYKLAKHTRKKMVYDIFDYYVDAFNIPKYLKHFIEMKDHKIINSAEGVIICSEKRKEQIKGTYPKRLEVLHNSPPNIKNNFKKLNLDKSKVKIVFVGILEDDRFLEEIADVIKDNPSYELHIGGFGKLETFFEDMSKRYVNILFYGKLSYKKTLELEKNCDIMLAIYDPAIRNHFYAAPNKFYEALLFGKPIIMVRNTGMSEIVEEYDIGELIHYNSESLQQSIENLVKRKDEWQEISFRMNKMYEEKYSWDEMERRLIGLYSVL